MSNRPQVNNPQSFASRFRKKRFLIIETLLQKLLETQNKVQILDIGGRRDYWDLLSPALRPKISVRIMNNEDLELGVGKRPDDPLEVSYEVGDACDMPQFSDRSFDFVHSNSVIEHVGSLTRMASMADEIRRVANTYYVQTPHLWFPIEPHYGVPFFHWLPKATRAGLGANRAIGYRGKPSSFRDSMAEVDHTELLNASLMRELFPDAEIRRERFFLMTKSLVAIRAR